MNDYSEQHFMNNNNTFSDNKDQAAIVSKPSHRQTTELADYASEGSHLSNDFDTYQYVMTPAKRFRNF